MRNVILAAAILVGGVGGYFAIEAHLAAEREAKAADRAACRAALREEQMLQWERREMVAAWDAGRRDRLIRLYGDQAEGVVDDARFLERLAEDAEPAKC